ncbi:hypothetical protein SSX86_016717 [Deinandra increscens subsp. villosa]|uniref:Alpha 1,4-glycosyltransferase domain-containing protein n=1 Tax=Deinandra increscens subsp. villosa TaxID=3103831 RepID=A0AAP0D603_9ASTR
MNQVSTEFNTMIKNRSLFAFISLVFLFLLSFNGVSIFSVKLPALRPAAHSPEKLSRPSRHLISASSSSLPVRAAAAGDPTNFVNPNAYLPHLRKSLSFEIESENSSDNRNKKLLKKMLAGLGSSRGRRGEDFPARVSEFFSRKNDTSSCKGRFFMTWISSTTSFNQRSIYSIESVFKSHPNACLLIVSNSLDSVKGRQILQPFIEKGFRVTSISPDFSYLFKNTMAESWFSRLIRGQIHTGAIPLGQNMSNLLRLCLLYKYGGVYIDADVIVLRSFSKLKNSIGAQSMAPNSKNWSRLNNAVMVFDKMHPLLYKFIEEFSLTFNGNKWGHNGPYMVSRVVSRLQGRPGYNFTVLPPAAFYPVSWDKIRVLFRGPRNGTEPQWLNGTVEQIRNQSYTLHLWNKQSRGACYTTHSFDDFKIRTNISIDLHCLQVKSSLLLHINGSNGLSKLGITMFFIIIRLTSHPPDTKQALHGVIAILMGQLCLRFFITGICHQLRCFNCLKDKQTNGVTKMPCYRFTQVVTGGIVFFIVCFCFLLR